MVARHFLRIDVTTWTKWINLYVNSSTSARENESIWIGYTDLYQSASGSSCGPTVAISAGFAPLSIGSETAGSVVIPAGANGVYGLKLTMDTVPLDGVCKLSSGFDCIGIFSREPDDLAPLMSILTGGHDGSTLHQEMKKGFDRLRVGVLPIDWGVDKEIAKGTWDQPSTVCLLVK